MYNHWHSAGNPCEASPLDTAINSPKLFALSTHTHRQLVYFRWDRTYTLPQTDTHNDIYSLNDAEDRRKRVWKNWEFKVAIGVGATTHSINVAVNKKVSKDMRHSPSSIQQLMSGSVWYNVLVTRNVNTMHTMDWFVGNAGAYADIVIGGGGWFYYGDN